MSTARRTKRCAVCGAQAAHRCFHCHQLYCQEHANCCCYRAKTAEPCLDAEQAVREATCAVCGRVVTDASGTRYASLDTCQACGALVCDLCIGRVEIGPGPHGFAVRKWCEDCAGQSQDTDLFEQLRAFLAAARPG